MDEIQVHRHLVAEVKRLRKENERLKKSAFWVGTDELRPVSDSYLSLFGGMTTAKEEDLPRTASGYQYSIKHSSLKDRLNQLIAYFIRHAKENTERADKEKREACNDGLGGVFANHQLNSYYFSGKQAAYENAAKKVIEAISGKRLTYAGLTA
jgi:hypothetical protein